MAPTVLHAHGGLRADLIPTGLVARSGTDTLSLQTVRVGSLLLGPTEPLLGACAPIAPDAAVERGCGRTAQLEHTPVTEWWTDRDATLRQGWTLHTAPRDSALVELEVVATAGWLVDVDADGRAATYEGSTGRLWRYTDLMAWDADDVPLPVWMEPTRAGLAVVVDTTGARFPVEVDPVLSTELKVTASDGNTGADFGAAVSRAGDLNGDGFDDLIVGADRASTTATDGGQAYVYYGSASGLDTSSEQILYGTAVSSSDYFGSSLAGGAELDNDGYDDVVVGVPYYDVGSTYPGAAFVYYGSATGPSDASALLVTASDGDAGDAFGWSVAIGGDVDGNGYGDLLVGSYGDDDGASDAGSLYVYYGSATGIEPSTEQKLLHPTAQGGALLGASVAMAGDLDGDGYDDMAGGATYDLNATGNRSGAAYVFYGSSTGAVSSSYTKLQDPRLPTNTSYGASAAAAGDVDGDGYDDLLIGSPSRDHTGFYKGAVYVYFGSATGVDASRFQHIQSSDGGSYHQFGQALDGGLDVDRDGFPDLFVGARGDDDGGTNAGAAYLYYGSSTGFVETSELKIQASDASSNDEFYVVAMVGDLDGNSVPDLAVGAPENDDSGTSSGALYVYPQACGIDDDGDGVCSLSDCDDTDPTVYPGASEHTGDGIDGDCDGAELCYADADDDGYTDGTTVVSSDTDCDDPGEATDTDPTGDCDDTDALANPGATEQVGDEVDQDCDETELCYVDGDGDGYTDGATTVVSTDLDCTDGTEATASVPAGDCDDSDATFSPAATELVGDAVDQDCDGTEWCYADADSDGFSDLATTVQSDDIDCGGAGEAAADADGGECDDTDARVNPAMAEVVGDGIDSDCDGSELCFVDADEDGFTDRSATTVSTDLDCTDTGEAGLSSPTGECDDTDAGVHVGATELPGDGIDSDCDGTELCFADADDDGFVDGVSGVRSDDTDCDDPGEGTASDPTGECDDTDATVFPGATDVAGDGLDTDCDGIELCFADADADGFTDGTTVESDDADCVDPGEADSGTPEGDCDDADAAVHPAATDVTADGVDSDCDGVELCFADADGDGFTDGTSTVPSTDGLCTAAGEARLDAPRGECDDADPAAFPGATEIPGDGTDQDCDGLEQCFVDADADGFTDGTTTVSSGDLTCAGPGEATASAPAGDCNDADDTVHPDAAELPGDGIDNDCVDGDATAPVSDASDGADDKGGCATASGGGSTGLLAVGLLALARRRRPRPPDHGSPA